MFLLRDKLIMQGEKRETSTQTCNETMLRAKLRVFVSRISPPLYDRAKLYFEVTFSSTVAVVDLKFPIVKY